MSYRVYVEGSRMAREFNTKMAVINFVERDIGAQPFDDHWEWYGLEVYITNHDNVNIWDATLDNGV